MTDWSGRRGEQQSGGDGVPYDQLALAKQRIRWQMRARMAAVAAGARRSASARIAEAVMASDPWRASDAVLAFSATKGEPEIGTVLAASLSQGRILALPRVGADGIVFHRVLRLEQLRPGYRGILEPGADTSRLPAGAWDQALLIVPGVAFDAAGGRLGRGGGHYDRFIAAGRQLEVGWRVVGICLEEQLVDQVPMDTSDERVDEVVTERSWLAAGRGPEYHDCHR